jgi:hypothetical protein
MYRDLEGIQTVFTGIALHRLFGANVAAQGRTLSAEALFVSGGYFPVLRIQPALGRLISPEDDRALGEAPVAVLSHACWENDFGSDPGILNQTLIVNGQPLTIVGVAPPGFDGTTLGSKPKIFVPITMRSILQTWFEDFDNRRSYWAYLFGRLKPGVSLEQARAELGAQYSAIINDVEAPLQKGMSEQTLKRFRNKPLLLESDPRGQSTLFFHAKAPLNLLLGVTGFVLLIACANVANLLLARSAAREGENVIAVRVDHSNITELFLGGIIRPVLLVETP